MKVTLGSTLNLYGCWFWLYVGIGIGIGIDIGMDIGRDCTTSGGSHER